MKREHLLYGLGYLFFAMLFLGPLSYASYQEYEGKKAAEVLAQWKKDRAKKERLAEKAIAQLRSDYPQRSEVMAGEEIPKIVRGTAGQAKLREDVGQNPSCRLWQDPQWRITETVIGLVASWEMYGDDNSNGWNIDPNGNVSVPNNAQGGNYRASYVTEEECDDGAGYLEYFYEFEVVCMKLTITATPSGSGS